MGNKTLKDENFKELKKLFKETKEITNIKNYQLITPDVKNLAVLIREMKDLLEESKHFNEWDKEARYGSLIKWLQRKACEFEKQYSFRTGLINEIQQSILKEEIDRLQNANTFLEMCEKIDRKGLSFHDEQMRELWEKYLEQFLVFFQEAKIRKDILEEKILKKKRFFTYEEQLEIINKKFSHHIDFDRDQLLDWIKQRIAEVERGQKSDFENIQKYLDSAEKYMDEKKWESAIHLLQKILEIKYTHFEAKEKLKTARYFKGLYAQFDEMIARIRENIQNKSWEQAEKDINEVRVFIKEKGVEEGLRETLMKIEKLYLTEKEKDQKTGKIDALRRELKVLLDSKQWEEARKKLKEGEGLLPQKEFEKFDKLISARLKWSRLIKEAESFKNKNDYNASLKRYIQADRMFPSDEIKEKIEMVKSLISIQEKIIQARSFKEKNKWREALKLYEDICSKTGDIELKLEYDEVKEEVLCLDYAEQAEELFDNGEYLAAISKYENAYGIRRREKFRQRIEEIRRHMAALDKEKLFAEFVKMIKMHIRSRDGKSALKLIEQATKIKQSAQLANLSLQAQAFIKWDELVNQGNQFIASRNWQEALTVFSEAQNTYDSPEIRKVLDFIKTEIDLTKICGRISAAYTGKDFSSAIQAINGLPKFAYSRRSVKDLVDGVLQCYEDDYSKRKARNNLILIFSGVLVSLVISILIIIM